MSKVLFVCCAGMSTSLLVERVNKTAKEKGIEIDVSAVAEADARQDLQGTDVILLGPQVRYLENSFKEATNGTNIKVGVVDMLAYGRLDGEKVLAQIQDMLTE